MYVVTLMLSAKNVRYLHPNVTKLHLHGKCVVRNYWFWPSHGEIDPTHYGDSTTFVYVNELNIFIDDPAENKVRRYNDHYMERY